MKYMSYRKMLEVYGKMTPFTVRFLFTVALGVFLGAKLGTANGADPLLLGATIFGLSYSLIVFYTWLSGKNGKAWSFLAAAAILTVYGFLVLHLLPLAASSVVLFRVLVILVCAVIPLVLPALDLCAFIWFIISLIHRKKTGGNPEEDEKVLAEFEAERRKKLGLPEPEPEKESEEETVPEESAAALPVDEEEAPEEADSAVTEESKAAAEETKEPAEETKAPTEKSKAAAEEMKAGTEVPKVPAKEKQTSPAGKLSGRLGFSAAHYRAPDVTEEEMEASFEEARRN